MTSTTYSMAGLLDAVRRETDLAAGMPGTFEDGARWAIANIEGRAQRADQLHRLVNEPLHEALREAIDVWASHLNAMPNRKSRARLDEIRALVGEE